MPKTVLALAAHPDDAEIYAGGLLAKLIAEGARAHIAVATDGRYGSFTEESAALIELRAEEMRRSAAMLGAEPPIPLGYPDMGLDALAPGELREKFVRLIRRYHPDVVIAPDPYALYEPHPDHRATAWAAFEALNIVNSPLVYPEHLAEGLAPHFVSEKYFYGDVLPGASIWVDITPWIEIKLSAVLEHHTQVAYLIEGLLHQTRLAGLNVEATLGPAAESPAALMAWGLREQAVQLGQRCGMVFTEIGRAHV